MLCRDDTECVLSEDGQFITSWKGKNLGLTLANVIPIDSTLSLCNVHALCVDENCNYDDEDQSIIEWTGLDMISDVLLVDQIC